MTNNKHGSAYAHGIVTYAMAAYGMTEKAFIHVLQKHHDCCRTKTGWRLALYGGTTSTWECKDGRFCKNEKAASDTSVSGWQVQALKAKANTGAIFPGIEPALEAAAKNLQGVFNCQRRIWLSKPQMQRI